MNPDYTDSERRMYTAHMDSARRRTGNLSPSERDLALGQAARFIETYIAGSRQLRASTTTRTPIVPQGSQASQSSPTLSAAALRVATETLRRAAGTPITSNDFRPLNMNPSRPRSYANVSPPLDDGFEVTPKKIDPKEIDLKKRHLRKEERDSLHKPASDWHTTSGGEVCKSACSLEVKDLLTKVR